LPYFFITFLKQALLLHFLHCRLVPVLPLISVVIPTYNRPDFLRRALASVRSQEGVELDIIIVDDASEQDLSAEFAPYPQVRYLRNEHNRGGGFSRNRGLKLAKGRYINFLDDDDVMLPGKLARQVEVFEAAMSSPENTENAKPLGIVTCHLLDERSGSEQRVPNAWRGDIYRETLERYTIKLTSTMLFLTEAVRETGGFDVQLPSSQEYDLMIRVTRRYRVDYVDAYLARACRSVDQISMNFDKKRRGAAQLFSKYDAAYKELGYRFYLRMQLKLRVLQFRFWVGRRFGEAAYRKLLRNNG
jgi:glycosyltransferase involved in cell wall biosynthesis